MQTTKRSLCQETETLHSQPLIVEKLLVMVFSEYSIAHCPMKLSCHISPGIHALVIFVQPIGKCTHFIQILTCLRFC